MASDTDRPFDIELKFILPKDKSQRTYKMRTAIWDLDMNAQMRTLDPKGQLNQKELWYFRLIDTVEGMDDKTVRKLDQYTIMYLTQKWLEYNDPSASFLEELAKDPSLMSNTK